MKNIPSRRTRLLQVLAAAALLGLVLALLPVPALRTTGHITLGALGVAGFLWLLVRAYRAFLWKVGRRLAFSYFLLGVLPVPMVLLLVGFAAYVVAGFFLGHLYRDATADLRAELELVAGERAAAFALAGSPPRGELPGVVFGYYRGGRRIAGDSRTPASWPAWLQENREPDAEDTETREETRERPVRFYALAGGIPTLAAAAVRTSEDGDPAGVVILYTGDLESEIRRRSETWVEVDRPDDPDLVRIVLMGRVIPLRSIRRERQPGEAEKFFKRLSEGERYWDDPLLWWAEVTGPLIDPATGKPLARNLTATLNGTPRTVARHLFSTTGEIDSSVWFALFIVAILLFDVYAVAALMAVFMIVGLSRAVNRLSHATEAVRAGDFSVRIPVRRQDQLGKLQRSFNEMAVDLESLVVTAAQKEVLEKELEIARDLQKSLIPIDLPAGEAVEFATLFEPTAAIGGDYFDVLRLSEREMAVMIADVSGHGLSTGLRMAMLKSALLILVEETRRPEEILRRLDAVVRNGESRVFVTATLAIIDLDAKVLRLTNAGHPPTYLVRGAQVREILLPSSALGGLGHNYTQTELPLERGDVLVWLSDGLIEAPGRSGDPFGYDRVVEALRGGAYGQTAVEVRDRLLTAIARYAGGQPPTDDRTLVVLRFLG